MLPFLPPPTSLQSSCFICSVVSKSHYPHHHPSKGAPRSKFPTLWDLISGLAKSAESTGSVPPPVSLVLATSFNPTQTWGELRGQGERTGREKHGQVMREEARTAEERKEGKSLQKANGGVDSPGH